MTNKRKIEILEEVKLRITSGNYNTIFICNVINEVLDNDEYEVFVNWFESKKPSETQYQKFTKSKFWFGKFAWWDESAKSQRIKFLNVLIKELHDE
jgi:hypothetical protein